MKIPSKITVHDVAARAGVSASTVSRVLNKNHDISSDTVALVESAVAELGYHRGATKRGRKATRSGAAPLTTSVAFLIPDTNIEAMLTPLTGQLMHGIEAVARGGGFNLLLTRLAERGALPPCLEPVQVKGMIVRSGASAKLQKMLPDIATVWIFKEKNAPARGDMVGPDNEAIGELAARYLIERGHRKLWVWNALPDHVEAKARVASFVSAAREGGAEVQHLHESNGQAAAEFLVQQRQNAGLLQRRQGCGLFLPLGDEATEAMYRALAARGQRYGDDYEMVSCNNDVPRLRALEARLPNIDICADEIGHRAAQTLLWRLQNPHEPRRTVVVQPHLEGGM